jgi:hypothetical protein
MSGESDQGIRYGDPMPSWACKHCTPTMGLVESTGQWPVSTKRDN